MPAELSVIGFDGIRVDGLQHDLTTLVQPSVAKGRAAGEAVVRLLEGEPGLPPQSVLLHEHAARRRHHRTPARLTRARRLHAAMRAARVRPHAQRIPLSSAGAGATPQAGAPVTIHARPRARSDSVTARAAR